MRSPAWQRIPPSCSGDDHVLWRDLWGRGQASLQLLLVSACGEDTDILFPATSEILVFDVCLAVFCMWMWIMAWNLKIMYYKKDMYWFQKTKVDHYYSTSPVQTLDVSIWEIFVQATVWMYPNPNYKLWIVLGVRLNVARGGPVFPHVQGYLN